MKYVFYFFAQSLKMKTVCSQTESSGCLCFAQTRFFIRILLISDKSIIVNAVSFLLGSKIALEH